MKKLKIIKKIFTIILCADEIIIRKQNNEIFKIDKYDELILIDLNDINSLKCFNNKLLLSDYKKLYIYSNNNIIQKICGNFVLMRAISFDNRLFMIERKENSIIPSIYNENLKIIYNGIWPINFAKGNHLFLYDNKFIKSYNYIQGKQKWQIDISNFGRNIAKDPKTGEILWDKPNEIKENLLADDKNIYVPLTGGQLLALDSQTGKKVWMWEQPRNGTFAIQDNYIYKQDGLTIFEIDTKNGKLVRKKHFNDDKLVNDFHASGPLWVYEDIIIVCDVLYGKICLLNRHTLEVEEFFSLNKKLINSKNAIVWHNNKLYVLDIDNTLHIFEKEK